MEGDGTKAGGGAEVCLCVAGGDVPRPNGRSLPLTAAAGALPMPSVAQVSKRPCSNASGLEALEVAAAPPLACTAEVAPNAKRLALPPPSLQYSHIPHRQSLQ